MDSALILDSIGGLCFLCLENSEVWEAELKLQNVSSLKSLLFYLGLQGTFEDVEKRSVPSCESCSKLLTKFEQVFQVWREAEMKMGFIAKEISSQMRSGSGESEDKASNHGNGSTVYEVRKRIQGKCLSKANAFQPEVVCEPIKSKMGNMKLMPEIQIKTETNELEKENDSSTTEDKFPFHVESDSQPEVDQVAEVKYLIPSSPSAEHSAFELKEAIPKISKSTQRRTQPIKYKITEDPSNPGHHLCEICNRSYKLLKSCEQHFREAHLGRKRRPILKKSSYDCNLCPKTFNAESTLGDHKRRVHKGLTFQCPHCLASFRSRTNKRRHELRCPQNPSSDRLPSKCRLCLLEFPGKGALNAHVDKEHAKVLKFRCEICGTRYKHSWNLSKHHKIVHKREVQSECKICAKQFYDKNSLKGHVAVVHQNVRFSCNFCKNSFCSKSALKNHVQVVHLGNKWSCPEAGCGREFRGKQLLDMHTLREHWNKGN